MLKCRMAAGSFEVNVSCRSLLARHFLPEDCRGTGELLEAFLGGSFRLFGLPAGFLLGYFDFPGKRAVRTVTDTLLALPTVVIGLLVYAFISRRGPLGDWELLFTVRGMAIGQVILGTPIVAAYTAAAIEGLDSRLRQTLMTLGASGGKLALTSLWEARFMILVAALTAFGRIVGEVGSGDFDAAALQVYADYPHRAEAEPVGAEGGAGGEHAYAPVPSEARRPHGGFESLPAGVRVEAESPYQPEVVEFLEAAQGVGLVVRGGQLYCSAQRGGHPRLPGDAELLLQRRTEYGYRFYCHCLFIKIASGPAASENCLWQTGLSRTGV